MIWTREALPVIDIFYHPSEIFDLPRRRATRTLGTLEIRRAGNGESGLRSL
jgi:hypothetical protein